MRTQRPTVEYVPVEPTVIAPDGGEVLLVAMTAVTRELSATKKRIVNEYKVKQTKAYSMKLTIKCQNTLRLCSGKGRI